MSERSIQLPYKILVDHREKAPYGFQGIRGDAKQDRLPLLVKSEAAHLEAGDYTLAGLESCVAIERKSFSDLFATLAGRREQFEAEHKRLGELEFAAVVVEATWQEILFSPPAESRMNPKTVFRTAIAWSQRYGVHWWCVPGRRAGEVTTFRMLDRFWQEVCRSRTSQLETPAGEGNLPRQK